KMAMSLNSASMSNPLTAEQRFLLHLLACGLKSRYLPIKKTKPRPKVATEGSKFRIFIEIHQESRRQDS
ncbi:MAG: hypothetical protein AB8F34_06740, partial [Akkermansiaceae bacterium]